MTLMMSEPPALAIPATTRRRRAYQAGFDARLRGVSSYASPYGDALERAAEAGRRPGWVTSLHRSWLEGWEAADSVVEPGTAT